MSKRILYIEDNSDSRLLVQRALTECDYELMLANDGIQGLEAVRIKHPDLILLDINLPDISGYEVARRIRAYETACHVPIIVLSANAARSDVDQATDAGCDDFISKPFSIRSLRERVAARVGA